MKEIKTSQNNWLAEIADAYKWNVDFNLIDDADKGIDIPTQSIYQMGSSVGATVEQWSAVGAAFGLSAAGIYMIIAAIADPEPTSKLALLIGGGAVLIFSGGVSVIWILTDKKPPKIKITQDGFEVEWE